MNAIYTDYKYCREIIKRHSKSFYYAFKQLPEDDANAVYAIYTFCRMADDIVDRTASVDYRKAVLDTFNSKLLQFEEGILIDEPMWRALKDVHQRYPLDLTAFKMQITGQQMDLMYTQPETIKDIERYSLYVAGSVGRMLLPILSTNVTLEMKENAEKLGIAMQITNILRDIGEDFKRYQRVYIPKQIMNKFNYTNQQLASFEINSDFINMWEYLAEYAETLYDEFLHYINQYHIHARLPLLLSMLVYKEILNEVRRNNYDCLTKRNHVSTLDKYRIHQEAIVYLKGEK
ncbi:phytoene synthase [Macrococcus epidermidis]|uniref:4,4'-diapophytoene synthase n=1 Tax=Macrococcus epidermidis TaxID=1902580 RepID=A0A327ZQN7_9STAP|nr:phytoene/squalene synthase family protein [Macrococcus epidermidis]RAK44612.1 phytoene synthase [Macrococcus epidermidis]